MLTGTLCARARRLCTRTYTLYNDATWSLVQLHGAMLFKDEDSDSDDSSDSLSTITEDPEEDPQDNMEQLLAPHLEGLLLDIFPPHLPPLALPG